MNAVARAEILQPNKQRVFSIAITSLDDRDRDRPSAWSSAVNQLTADALGDEQRAWRYKDALEAALSPGPILGKMFLQTLGLSVWTSKSGQISRRLDVLVIIHIAPE
ncbi:hypothetical protein [Pseudomonas yamanorum]